MNRKQKGFIIALVGFILIAINGLLYIFNPNQAKPFLLIFGIVIYMVGMFAFKKAKK